MSTLKEAYLGIQTELGDTKQELSQAQQSVAPWVQVATEAEEGRQAALVEARRFKRCLDTETIQPLHHREERECLKREKILLQDENQLLLETREGSSFEDGYFTACFEVATALPPPFDLLATLNWDRG